MRVCWAVRYRRQPPGRLDGIVERLIRQVPELGRDKIKRAVHGEYDGNKVRDFVPILLGGWRARNWRTQRPGRTGPSPTRRLAPASLDLRSIDPPGE